MLSIANEKGQGLVEYALILVLIAVAVAGFVGIFGQQLNNTFVEITNQLPGG